jgi:hypothetical protein
VHPSRTPTARGWLTSPSIVVLCLFVAAGVRADAIFYREVPKDGLLYVFAHADRYEAFDKSGGTETGPVITRPGYGPSAETVIFDSEDAINLYNFKHGLPGEVFPKPDKSPPPSFPAGKISGLMFGDYYWYDKWHQDVISADNPNYVEGQQGFWLRRGYFTYDLSFSERLTTRFRLEVNSDGHFTSPGNITPYVKDASLGWTYAGRHQAVLGIQPTLTFDWVDTFWGLRHIEKSPADLYRLDPSRDFGLSLSGPLPLGGLSYAAQLGDDTGSGSETDKYKIVRLEGRFDRNPGVGVDAVYSYGKRPAGQDRQTFSGLVGYRKASFRAAGMYLWQERKSGTAAADQTIAVWSAFGVWEFKPKRADVYARFDRVRGHQGALETGLPGADGIDYWILSPAQPFKLYIVGGEWFLRPSIRFSPNLETAKYDREPDPVNFPGRDQDRIFRITFFWTF